MEYLEMLKLEIANAYRRGFIDGLNYVRMTNYISEEEEEELKKEFEEVLNKAIKKGICK